MELFLIYVWLKLDSLNALSIGVVALSAFAMFVLAISTVGESQEWKNSAIRFGKRAAYVGGAAMAFAVLLPSSKDVAILAGAHYAFKAAESPEAAKVMTLMRQRVNAYLDEAIKATPAKEAAK